MTSFELYCICKDCFETKSHSQVGGAGLQCIFLGDTPEPTPGAVLSLPALKENNMGELTTRDFEGLRPERILPIVSEVCLSRL